MRITRKVCTTYVNGSKEGIHGFLVPIRDSELNTKENVDIWDMGYKLD